MYYWICQKCDLKVWGAENCWCGITREQNSALAEQKTKKKGNNKMEHIKEIERILGKYSSNKAELFEDTVRTIINVGIPDGSFQDYALVSDIVSILGICYTIVKENK